MSVSLNSVSRGRLNSSAGFIVAKSKRKSGGMEMLDYESIPANSIAICSCHLAHNKAAEVGDPDAFAKLTTSTEQSTLFAIRRMLG